MCPVSSWIQWPNGLRTKCFCTAFLHLAWIWPTALRTLCLKTNGLWLLVHSLIYCHPLLQPPSLVSQQTMILWKPRCGQGCLCLLQVRMNTAYSQVLQSVASMKTHGSGLSGIWEGIMGPNYSFQVLHFCRWSSEWLKQLTCNPDSFFLWRCFLPFWEMVKKTLYVVKIPVPLVAWHLLTPFSQASAQYSEKKMKPNQNKQKNTTSKTTRNN